MLKPSSTLWILIIAYVTTWWTSMVTGSLTPSCTSRPSHSVSTSSPLFYKRFPYWQGERRTFGLPYLLTCLKEPSCMARFSPIFVWCCLFVSLFVCFFLSFGVVFVCLLFFKENHIWTNFDRWCCFKPKQKFKTIIRMCHGQCTYRIVWLIDVNFFPPCNSLNESFLESIKTATSNLNLNFQIKSAKNRK